MDSTHQSQISFIITLIFTFINIIFSKDTSSAGGKENWDFWCAEGSTEC
jgi:hypothetical protein